MNETTRRQYLSLLGVDLWLPRDAAEPEAGAATALPPPVAAPLPETTVKVSSPVDPVERIAPPSPVSVPAIERPVAASPVVASPAPTPSSTVTEQTADTLGCSLLWLPEGLLLVATYVTPQAPGLSGPEHALLVNIASALAPGAVVPAPDEFRWPPPGVRLAVVARTGAAAEALTGLLAEQRRKRQLRDIALLGETMAPLLQEAATRLGLRLIVAPSLAAMLADPARKRACWESVKQLKRGGG